MNKEENDIREPLDRGGEPIRRILDDGEDNPVRGQQAIHPFLRVDGMAAESGNGLNCRGQNPFCDMPLAMVYCPVRKWRKLYGEEKALEEGTLFCELDKPIETAGGY